MTVGEKIKFIRNFRGMTQKELGIGIGFDEKGADNRIAQYETNYRVPKKDTLLQIAKVLDVNPLNFISEVSGSAEDIMQTFFWLDEDNPGAINLFQLVRNPGKCNASDDTSVRYNDSDDWPAHPPVALLHVVHPALDVHPRHRHHVAGRPAQFFQLFVKLLI